MCMAIYIRMYFAGIIGAGLVVWSGYSVSGCNDHVRMCAVEVIKAVRIYSTLLSSFAEVLRVYIHCARAPTTVEDHGCTGKGRHAMRTTT